MAKAIKYDNYIDSSGITHNRKRLKDILSYPINYFPSQGIGATTGITSEVEFIHQTIAEAGTYIFWASIPLNYHGQVGRELYLRMKINGMEKWYSVGVCNSYIYTMSIQLFQVCKVPANGTVVVTIQDASGKTYACGSFNLYYMKID